MNAVLNISRVIVGVLFIFSGLIKANDPSGLSYKMQEFFEVWGMHGFNDYTLAFSILMIAFEIIAGVAVLLGWKMRLFSWLLLLLTIFFTFLTGYALFSGKIRECGCFGDCIPLSAQQSFIKDIILLVLISLLFAKRDKLASWVSPKLAIGALVAATLFSFAFQWYVLVHLPVIDCLPYRVGKNIRQQMKVPAGAIPDSSVINFVYEKDGKQVEFTAENFPEDFDDSIYRFVTRYDKLVRKGNADIPIKDFVLITADGIDSTQGVLDRLGYQVFFFTRGIDKVEPGWMEDFNTLYQLLGDKKIRLNLITSYYDNVALWAKKAGIAEQVSIFKSDAVAIKTAARADPTLYLLNDGDIIGKWSYADFEEAAKTISALPEQKPL
jgi:uncharacterized membrane protein YphA (DoxX/SURF4 family)